LGLFSISSRVLFTASSGFITIRDDPGDGV
jgi:hypothetical protein